MASSSRLRDASLVTPQGVRRLLATAGRHAVISGVGASTAGASVTSVEGMPFSGVVTTLGVHAQRHDHVGNGHVRRRRLVGRDRRVERQPLQRMRHAHIHPLRHLCGHSERARKI